MEFKTMSKNFVSRNKQENALSEEDFFAVDVHRNNFQRAAICAYKEKKNYFNSNIARQKGKTFIGLRLAIWSALLSPRSTSMVIAYRTANANHLFKEAESVLKEHNISYENNGISELILELWNGSKIMFYTMSRFKNEDHLFRGRNYDPVSFIYYDEYPWFISSDVGRTLEKMRTYRVIDENTIHLGLSSDYMKENLEFLFPKDSQIKFQVASGLKEIA
jgi:hypothetical protein